jgi:hypothetical protein
MPLEFRGAAVIDPPGRSIRFAGVPVGSRQSAMVICEVPSAVLRALCDVPHTDREGLLRVFNEHRNRIWEAASQKFDEGEHRPIISLEDLARR